MDENSQPQAGVRRSAPRPAAARTLAYVRATPFDNYQCYRDKLYLSGPRGQIVNMIEVESDYW